MANQGWAKLNNASYKRIIPNLCPFCEHLGQTQDGEWLTCTLKHKRLSNPHAEKGKCEEFKDAGGTKLDQASIDKLIESARDHKRYLAGKRAALPAWDEQEEVR